MTSSNPAPSVDHDARTTALYASLVEDAFDFTVAIREDFVIAYASRGITPRLGLEPEDLVGHSVADFVHPDDLERALLHLQGWQGGAAQAGTTTFRVRHLDGTYRPFDVTAAKVDDGVEAYLAVYARPVDYQQATDEVMAQLLAGGTREDALRPVLDVFSWEVNASSISIAWYEPGRGHRFVSTGLPRELTGAEDEPGRAWAIARQQGREVLDLDQSLLDRDRTELATEAGRRGYWVAPVDDAASGVRALVTVWARAEQGRPDGHAYGMSMAQAYIELILRWSRHLTALNEAALQDPLTGLGNRKALFDVLEAGTTHGALLFCDLDHFKPVNDAWGHAAGDHVLRQIAQRMKQAVRSGDLVARTGGDEFVVLAPDASLEQAAALAQRIRTAVAQPTSLCGTEVVVGVTIGVAHADEALTEATLAGADDALMLAKANARGTVRWAPGPVPASETRDAQDRAGDPVGPGSSDPSESPDTSTQ